MKIISKLAKGSKSAGGAEVVACSAKSRRDNERAGQEEPLDEGRSREGGDRERERPYRTETTYPVDIFYAETSARLLEIALRKLIAFKVLGRARIFRSAPPFNCSLGSFELQVQEQQLDWLSTPSCE